MDQRAVAVSNTLEGRYTLERELGRGGMATVYLAEDLKLHRRVALKVLHAELGATLGPERFLREIAIASRLTHPHILQLHDSGGAEGRLYYAMPYVEGESLRQRLQREQQLSVEETVAIVCAVASALGYAHRAGVIHRDIKPENILLARDPAGGRAHPLVADFGIARAVDAAAGERLTETGLALGTPGYMSPEQAGRNGQLDGRSDVYALGCVAYEMLAGAPPFTGPSAQAVLVRHAVDPVPPLRTVRPTVPQSVDEAVARALAKVPADRFATAEEFAEALVAKAAPTRSRLPTGDPPRVTRRTGMMIAATVAVAAALVGALRWRRSTTQLVAPSATRIAVLPLHASVKDTALIRLARDLAVTVGASLDGVGGMEVADRLSVSAATADRTDLSPGETAALARRLGAKSVLRGTLVRDGPGVRADLGLYDTETDAPLTRGITVTAHRDSLRALTDSVVWVVLRQVWRRGEPPTPSLDAVTTRSLPALRAFLEGERSVEQNRWDEAALAYRSAIAADSTFWLAYFRYALAQNWLELPVEPEFSAAMYRHRELFPERDRLLVEAWAADDSLPRQLELFKEVTRRFPDYWPGWFMLGDRLFHGGVFLGHNWREVQSTFNHAVSINPRLRPAWQHMWQNSYGKDTVESGRVYAQLRELWRNNPPVNSLQSHIRLVVRLMDAVSRSPGQLGPAISAMMDSLARDNWERFKTDPDQSEVAAWSPFLQLGYPASQIELNRRTLRLGMEGVPAAAQLRGIAWSWAVRGAWDSALVTMRVALRAKPHPADDQGLTPLDDYGLAVLGVFLGALEPGEAMSRRPPAWATIQRLEPGDWKTESLWTLAWLDGIAAFSRKDRIALERARADSRRSGHPLGAFLDRSLAAYGRALAGDRAAAGRDLAALQICSVTKACGHRFGANMATDRLATATWLLEAGDTTQATRLLIWYESLQGNWDASFNHVTSAMGYLMLARIEEAQGDIRSAREHSEQFLRRFDSPMPGQRHLVEDAQAALARLAGRDDPPAAQ
jgi:tRNA A-37 threonylcarbamoyl transferase component Bud32/tetratricopeptide (TPR) repeat protein/TolB-like protein